MYNHIYLAESGHFYFAEFLGDIFHFKSELNTVAGKNTHTIESQVLTRLV